MIEIRVSRKMPWSRFLTGSDRTSEECIAFRLFSTSNDRIFVRIVYWCMIARTTLKSKIQRLRYSRPYKVKINISLNVRECRPT